ncbi:dicarboxylate/amino acid:cation symporter [Clostridium sp. AM58-1XD]|uniref:dicarboxylate/amino acid:cation symporter n=1 Tax=Clostridium sp. AM58-1XD TaxID=2292307 RepID=UPI000E54C0CE|nr:dicarboxylate/amino acid:cation symporter [Clostridium sp. AM58-1XD]RGY99297.1 dicarboxylate/amino acid:cation symporter [Clostridium sp. AM58-1XD]
MEKKKIKIGLVPRLIIGIILGVIVGSFCPEWFCRLIVTLSSIFSSYLKFVIPLMILSFVTMGIADLTQGAGKLLGITALIAYGSTLIGGSMGYGVAVSLFPGFMNPADLQKIADTADKSLAAYFSISITPIMDTISAVVLAFILGLCLSVTGAKSKNSVIYNGMNEFSGFIGKVLNMTIIPLLPLYICGTFTDMTYSGKTFVILGILWKVFLVVIILHWIYMILQFTVAGSVTKKNPFSLLRKQLPGYTTALGTQSSAATIPVNLICAENEGVSQEIRNFVVPLCANIHMCGSMITITCCSVAVLLMNGLPVSFTTVFPFMCTLGIAMVASPGAPGGSIMTALPFLPMVGLGTEALQALMIALYITQDSFGTACNVSGDNAIGLIVDKINDRFIKKAV